METLYNGFDGSKYRPSPLLKQMCDAGYLGRKTGKGFFAYEAAYAICEDETNPAARQTGYQCRSIPTGHCRARIGQARSGRKPHAGFDEAKRDHPLKIFRSVSRRWEAVRLQKHRRRVARNEALLVGRDHPDGDR